jgi:hypothetical protein
MSEVFAVRCPAPVCRKYMLVEAADRGTIVPCLICRAGIQIPAGPTPAVPLPPLPPTAPAASPYPAVDFSPK